MHDHNTRCKNDLIINAGCLAITLKSPINMVIKIYNKVPLEIKSSKTLYLLKKKLKSYLLTLNLYKLEELWTWLIYCELRNVYTFMCFWLLMGWWMSLSRLHVNFSCFDVLYAVFLYSQFKINIIIIIISSLSFEFRSSEPYGCETQGVHSYVRKHQLPAFLFYPKSCYTSCSL